MSARIIGCFVLLALIMSGGSPCLSVKRKPILIGASLSAKGKYRAPSWMIERAYRLWEKEANHAGGLLGRPVRLIICDDESSSERAVQNYQKLIVERKVDLIFSPYSTPITLAASRVTEKRGFVMLACGASGESIWERGYRYVFGVYSVAGRYFIGPLDLIARRGLQSVAILHDSTAFTVAAAQAAKQWAKRFGLTVVQYDGYKKGKSDLPKLLRKMRKCHPDGLILSAYPSDAYMMLRLMKVAEYRPQAVAISIAPALPDFWKKAGTMAEGVMGPSQWEPSERIPYPGTEDFIKRFQAFAGKLPSYHAGSAYAACQIMQRAVAGTQSLDQKAIRNFILSLDTVTVIGRFKVDATGKQIGHNPLVIQWQDRKKEIVYPSRMRTAPPRW